MPDDGVPGKGEIGGSGSPGAAPPAERAGKLAELVRDHAPSTQELRRPAQPVMRAFAEDGLLRILAPRNYGGEEATGLAFMELVEAVSRVDGSAGWTVMTLNEEIEISAGYVPADTMRSVCTSSPAVIVAGSGAALGRVPGPPTAAGASAAAGRS